ncbi:MAG: 2Fe-2S iron-sulfur cluster-binding protein [Myxococcota bacterium]
MPRVSFEGRIIECEPGQRLRAVLLRAGVTPHNGGARLANCRGLGTCGTCAVRVEAPAGAVSPPTRVERWRLGFPPHRRDRGLRLACQLRVHGDLQVSKYAGFWGQQVDTPR